MTQAKVRTSLDPTNAMNVWGQLSGLANGDLGSTIKRLQTATSDVQNAYLEAFNRQMDVITTANRSFAHLIENGTQIRQPKDMIAEAFDFALVVADSVSEQGRTWIDLVQKLQESYSKAARETAQDLRK